MNINTKFNVEDTVWVLDYIFDNPLKPIQTKIVRIGLSKNFVEYETSSLPYMLNENEIYASFEEAKEALLKGEK